MRLLGFTFLLLFTWMLTNGFTEAQDGYEIRVELADYQEDTIYLAYYYGDKQYIRDTVSRASDGAFIFKGTEALPGGMYLVVMQPDNSFFQLLINPEEQHFTFKSKKGAIPANAVVEGSPDNKLFYEYMRYLGTLRPRAEEIRSKMEAAPESEKQQYQDQLSSLDAEVSGYQEELIEQHPNFLTAAIVRANMAPETPKFTGTEEEKEIANWRWTQQHYFDALNMRDDRLVRTPFLQQRIDFYFNKLIVQHPDTLIEAADRIISMTGGEGEVYKYLVVNLLNEYAKSKIVGMDAVYVHLAKNYYCNGKAPWVEEEQLQKICDNATTLEPILVGKIAPDLKMQNRAGEAVNIHGIDAKYTVLIFWRYDCGHCKKTAPDVVKFFNDYKNDGVKVATVCAKYTDDVPQCWEFVDEKNYGEMINLVDPYNRSRFSSIYNIKSTPRIFVLDEEKKIVSKGIGVEQLPELMDNLLGKSGAAN